MKQLQLYIIILIIVCLGFNHPSYGEIKNGYDKEIIMAERWIRNLNEIAKGTLRNEMDS